MIYDDPAKYQISASDIMFDETYKLDHFVKISGFTSIGIFKVFLFT